MSVKSVIVGVFMLVGLASPVWAQSTVTGTSKLVWDQPGVASAAEAQAFAYKFYPNGTAIATPIAGAVTCTGVPPAVVTCQVVFPTFKAGPATLTLSATNASGESLQSTPLAFVYVVVPAAPSNLRVQ